MTVPNKNIVGKRIQQARLDKGMTQDQLSAKLARRNVQIDRAGISKIESRSRRISDFELKAVCRVLEVTSLWLLGD